MELKGTIKQINSEVTRGNFTFRELVLTTQEQYPQDILIQFVKDKTTLLNNFNVGDSVEVAINIRGKEWTDTKTGEVKYFNTIVGWKIQSLNTEEQETKSVAITPPKSNKKQQDALDLINKMESEEEYKKQVVQNNEEDDLPF